MGKQERSKCVRELVQVSKSCQNKYITVQFSVQLLSETISMNLKYFWEIRMHIDRYIDSVYKRQQYP